MPAQFLTDSALNAALERILRDAEEQLILISPYIKLHERLQALLKARVTDDKLFIQVVFGKNKENPSKSMSMAELEFFMQFPNIEIRYEKRLHAKYYTNDSEALITSMNLYDYSQDNNIESGILTRAYPLVSVSSLADRITGGDDVDRKAIQYFEEVVKQSELIYKKEPEYTSALLGLTKKYTGSKIRLDKVVDFVGGKLQDGTKPIGSRSAPSPASAPAPSGYCIRTGKPVPFDIKKPMCEAAMKSWEQYRKPDYPEKYCHFSGEPSNGETSFAKPILKKNWSKAKPLIN